MLNLQISGDKSYKENTALDRPCCAYARRAAFKGTSLWGTDKGFKVLRYKDTKKDILKRGGALNTWRAIVGDRLTWRKFTTDVCDEIENVRRQSSIGGRPKRHERGRK